MAMTDCRLYPSTRASLLACFFWRSLLSSRTSQHAGNRVIALMTRELVDGRIGPVNRVAARPRPGKRDRIGDRELIQQRSLIRERQPFDHVEGGGRVAEGIVSPEVGRVDHDRLAIPTTA